MATSDIINRLDRDMFKNPNIDKEEMFRRLNYLVETLYTIISQAEGSLLVNNNEVIYVTVSGAETSGITITRVVFDVNGNTVEAVFENGKLIA